MNYDKFFHILNTLMGQSSLLTQRQLYSEPAAAKKKRLEVQQAADWLRFQNFILTLPSHKDFNSSTEEAEALI